MKRILSFLLAILMLVTLVPVDSAHAMEGEKLDVVLLNDGQYMIKLPGVDYTMARQVPEKPDINPTDNPKDFSKRTVKVDITQILLDATGTKKVTVIVTCQKANYYKEYTLTLENMSASIKTDVPKEKWNPQIKVKFDDGRDSRYIVEAKSKPTNVVNINIGFLGHTGVATRWHGAAARPNVKGNYIGLNNTDHKFDLPQQDQNSILREGNNPWAWKDHDNTVNLQVVPEEHIRANDLETAQTMHFVIEDKIQGQLASSKYHFHITGDSYHGFTATMREKYTVDFDAGDGTWKTAKPAQQFSAHGLKLNETFMDAPDTIGPVTVPNGESDLTPPATEGSKPAKKFAGWSTTKNGPAVDIATYEVTGNVTFYALYAEEEQGKVKVIYKDTANNKVLEETTVEGNKDKPVDASKIVLDKKFVGYERTTQSLDVTGKTYKKVEAGQEGQLDEIVIEYKKLADVIPEKDPNGGDDNTKPEGYVTVTYVADKNIGKLLVGGTESTESSLKYFVNPNADIAIKNVTKQQGLGEVTAKVNDDKKDIYKLDETNKWTFSPSEIDNDTILVKADVTLTANFVKEKGTVTYKYNENVNTTEVQNPDTSGIPAVPTDAKEYEAGTKVKPETTVAPKDKKVEVKKGGTLIGYWKFSGWTPAELEVKKNSEKNKNEFTGTWTFEEAGKKSVTYEFASGTNGEALPQDVTNLLTKASESKYLNETVNAPTDTYNTVVISTGSKQGKWTFDGWYAGTTDANNKGKALNVTEAGPNKFIGVWTFTEDGKKDVTFEFAFYNSKGNKQIPNNAIGQFKPTLPSAQNNKYVGSNIDLPKFEGDKDNVKVDKGDLQGTWKFDGWYKSTDTTFTNKLTAPKVSETDAENKLIGKWILTETETKEVKRVFVIDKNIMGADKDVPVGHVLPQDVTKQKPNDTTNYIGSKQTPGKDDFKAVSQEINGKKGMWTFKKWDPKDLIVKENPSETENKFTGTWTWKEAEKVTVKYVFNTNPADKKLPKELADLKPADGTDKIYETDVVPPTPLNLSSEAVQKALVEKDKDGKEIGTWTAGNWSNPVKDDVNKTLTFTLTWTFTEAGKPAPQPEQPPMPDYNPWWPIWFGSTKTEVKKEEPKHLERHDAYIAGYPDGTVRPDGKITRAEVSAIFARLTENSAPANYSPKFSDVLAYDWFCDSVMKLSNKDIIKGYPDGTFKPNKSITRAEFAVIASKYIKNPKAADETFSDVPMNHWAKDAIAMVKAEGWISGYTDGTFKPDAPITRAEAVSIVNRMFDRAADGEFVREHGFEITKFGDLNSNHWAYYEMIEATHSHDYERIDKRTERWEKIVK